MDGSAKQLPLDDFDVEHLKALIHVRPDMGYRIMSSVISVGGAICGILCVLLPLLPFVALAIRLNSPGPVFYVQRRVGLQGKVFSVIKFRTMRQDAEQGGAVWAQQNDVRITKVGQFLRKYRIDEIPQFINVLCGEMALIGPRPERPEFVEQLRESIPLYDERHHVKPGITGWAQVNYKYGNSEHDALEKLKYDFYWMAHRSVWLDCQVLLQSVRVVFTGFGSH